jgi:hypothetical protein
MGGISMYSKSFLERHSNCWWDEYYPSICYGVHPAFIEEGKQTEMEEDEDD